MDEGKERVRRQLPRVPSAKGKGKHKSKSSGNIPKHGSTTGSLGKHPHSSSSLSDKLLALSPPGSKSRDFTNYSLNTIRDGEDGEDSCVTVAVRVRPFSDREVRLGAKQAVDMSGQELVIVSRENKTLHFCYDYCFWSFDNESPEYASQATVYTCLAHPLLDSAFQGYNTCLFAYGQTGSGKSYCIMGENDSPGIIPQFADELFERIKSQTNEDNSFKVEVSYYEIYKERINDLLASVKHTKRVNLRVREHPVMGPYVEDLSTYVASSYSDIAEWLALGNRFRATAATGMNDKSSRSHSVFSMVLTQAKIIEGEGHSRVSHINLIDLAGSERSSVSNTSGERLKEGASINRSLHTLSKVISLLAERSTGKRKKVYIPYRDSTLTWLLKESLGGNSKTAMIATVSPADIHKEESLSTLRYAQQARSIMNVARVNEDPQSKLIRDLHQEIEWLRSQIHGPTVNMEDLLKSQKEVQQMQTKLKEYEKLMEETSRSWEERLKITEDRKIEEAEQLKRAGVSFKVDNKLPNLVNLNEDPQLSEMLLYVLKEGKTTVGRNVGCDIQLMGTLVARNHCIIDNKEGEVTLYPSTNEEAQTFVNGTLLSSPTVLHHSDRLVIAGDHFFRFNHPLQVKQGGVGRKGGVGGKNFEYARDEFIKAQTERLEAERLKERQEMMEKLEAVKQAAGSELTKQKQSYEERLRDLEGTLVGKNIRVSEQLQQQENEAEERILQLERQKRELEEETIAQRHIIELERQKTQQEYEEMEEQSSRLMKELEQEKLKLEMDVDSLQKNQENRQKHISDNDTSASSMDLIRGSELLRIATMIQEANVISKSLLRPFTFTREDLFENDEISITVKVTNTKKRVVTFWSPEKFETRLEQMRELYQHTGSVTSLDQDELTSEDWAPIVSEGDPFHDPEEEWVHDSLLSSYSPLSATDGRQSSVLSIFTPPGYSSNHTPRSSTNILAKRALLGSVSSTPVLPNLTPQSHTPYTSPSKHAAQAIAQICYDKMAPILAYQHTSNPSIFFNILNHIKKLKSIINGVSECVKGECAIDVFLSLQLMFNSARGLEPALLMMGGARKEILSRVQCRSTECVQHLVEDISRQTGLYCSRLIQALLSNATEECKESIDNIEESLEGVVSCIGQISLCLRVEEAVCERDSNTHIRPPEGEDEYYSSLFQYGYQTWCSGLLGELLRSLHCLLDQLQSLDNDDTLYSLRDILGHVTHLLYQITEVQELFWHMTDKDTLDIVVIILSKVWRMFASADTMCSLIFQATTSATSSPPSIEKLISVNQQLSIWSEQTAISFVTFLRQQSDDEVVAEVQAIARNIAMTTRSFNQHLRQKSITFPLFSSPQRTGVAESGPSLPPDFFLPSPSPPQSSGSSGQQDDDMLDTSNTSLV